MKIRGGVVTWWCGGKILLTDGLPFGLKWIKEKTKKEKYKLSFNDEFRVRTKKNALNIVCLYNKLKQRDELRIMGTQLLRSATSVAANFRASCRARSEAEHYSKLSITIEECDETLFWLELIEETGWIDRTLLDNLKQETLSILMVLSKTRKTLKTG